jgi:hypothetical protein
MYFKAKSRVSPLMFKKILKRLFKSKNRYTKRLCKLIIPFGIASIFMIIGPFLVAE